MTVEFDRINVLEGKISGVVEHVRKLSAENEKLRQLVKDLKAEKKTPRISAGKFISLTRI